MFIEETKKIDVVIYYQKIGLHYQAFSKSEFEELELEEDEKAKYKRVEVKMKQLTWGLYNDLQESAIDFDPEGNRRFNYKKYKENRLVRLIDSWDATSVNNGKEVPVRANEKTIKSLAPEIAESILNTYDQVCYLSEEDEGK